MFELAAYRTANPTGKITLAPLFLEACMLALWLSSYMGCFFYQVSFILRYGDRVSFPAFIIGTLPAITAMHWLRYFSVEKQQLIYELAKFDVRNADCRSEFDKEFIHAAITEWYGTAEQFSEYVRGPLRDELITNLHRSGAPVAYALMVTTAPVSIGLEYCLGLWKGGAPMISIMTQLVGDVLATNMFWFVICVHIAISLCDYFAPKGRGCFEILKSLMICVVFGICASIGGALSSLACRLGFGTALGWFCFTLMPICLGFACSKRLLRHQAGLPTTPSDNAPEQA